MFDRVLVPLDGSPQSAALLQVAVPIPLWMYSAELGTSLAMPVDASWDDDAFTSAQTYLNSLATRLRDTGIESEGHARIGDVVATIDSVADEIEADLIVIATHARVGAARAVLGSTADAVVRTARRPVLLVRRQASQERTAPPVGILATTVKGGTVP